MAAQAVTLQIDGNGILTGATNVDVGGTLYKVLFVDGTCAAVFTGCYSGSDFAFTSESAAQIASQALLAQVFLDGAQGVFDSVPHLTFGCPLPFFCLALTPYGFDPPEFVQVFAAGNDNIAAADFVLSTTFPLVSDSVFTQDVFARWTRVAAAPNQDKLDGLARN
jgi:hypothetical protein